MVFEIDGKPFRMWLKPYWDARFWRIYAGTGTPEFCDCIFGQIYELTFLAEEIGPDTGPLLVETLRDPNTFRWPLFAHESAFPSYAWSKAAKEGIDQVWAEEKARQQKRDAALARRQTNHSLPKELQ